MWSERYDRELKDIFALQDDIVQKIVTTLNLQVALREQGVQVSRRWTDNLEAYDSYLRGVGYLSRATKEANLQARQMLEKAIELDPRYAGGYATLGMTYWLDWWFQWNPGPQNLQRAFALGQKAVALNDAMPAGHLLLGNVYLYQKRHEQAQAAIERAITLDPNFALAYLLLGDVLLFAGRPQEAVGFYEQAMRLNPHYPASYVNSLGAAYLVMKRYEEAIAALKQALSRNSNILTAHLHLAAAYSELGQEAEARAEAAEALRLSPNFSLEVLRQAAPLKDPALLERYITALRQAGLK